MSEQQDPDFLLPGSDSRCSLTETIFQPELGSFKKCQRFIRGTLRVSEKPCITTTRNARKETTSRRTTMPKERVDARSVSIVLALINKGSNYSTKVSSQYGPVGS
jgi:hypothetical protein